MSAPRIKEVQLSELSLESVRRALNSLRLGAQAAVEVVSRGGDLVRGKLLGPITLNSPDGSPKVVSHGLKRKGVRWVLVSNNQAAHVWESAAKPVDELNTLLLQSDFFPNAVTGQHVVYLWVF